MADDEKTNRQFGMQAPGTAGDEARDGEQEDEEPLVAGAAVDDITAGISTSGVGGTPVGEEPDVGAESQGQGLDQIVEQGRRAGWGKTAEDQES